MVHYLDASRFESCCMHLHTVLLQMKVQSIGYILPGKIFQITVKVLIVTVDIGSLVKFVRCILLINFHEMKVSGIVISDTILRLIFG